MWQWIKDHPQRLCGLLLTTFGSMQGSLALYQASLPPLVNAGITTGMGLIVTVLAWGIKNLKDKDPLPSQE